MGISRKKPGIFDDGPIDLTQEGAVRLRERLEHLKKILPDLAAETQRTAAYGDRSENAEYKEAKSALRRTQWQIWTLEDRLKRVVEIKTPRKPSGIVELGSTVVVESTTGIKKTYKIVGPYETNPTQARISNQSPLGTALMYRKTGDVIRVRTPGGTQEYRIVEVT